MNKYLEIIKTHLAEHTVKYVYPDAHTLLEHLWYSYTESNPISSERLRELNAKLDPVLRSLPLKDTDMLFGTFCDISDEYERASFLEGMRVGARLVLELFRDGTE